MRNNKQPGPFPSARQYDQEHPAVRSPYFLPTVHCLCSLRAVEYAEKHPRIQELESLDERAGGLIVVYGVHLSDENIRVLFHVSQIVLVRPSLKVSVVSPLFISFRFLFRDSA